MNPEDLQPASYKGVEWLVTSTVTSGGRKVARKRFVNSDLQVVEDLGLLQREFIVSGVIAARRDNTGAEIQSYQEVRDALLEALEAGGTGVLVHPFFGRVENIVVAAPYSLAENTSRLGDASIEITFAVSNTDGLPAAQPSVLAEVVTASDAVLVQAEAGIADVFEVTPSFTGNFTAAIAKGQGFVNLMRSVSSVATIIEDEIDPYNDKLDQFEASLAALTSDPEQLSEDVREIADSTNRLYSTKLDTFNTFVRMFDFGDDDPVIISTTAGLAERSRNEDIFNTSVQSMALSYAYLNGVQLDFATTDDIDEIAQVLDDQYQKMVDVGTLTAGEDEELTKLRLTSSNFFNAQRTTKPQIIEVRTNPTSTRLLSYQYYGDSNLGADIARLNEIDDSAFISGQVKVLSA